MCSSDLPYLQSSTPTIYMQARERIVYSDTYMMLCDDKNDKNAWISKKVVVTQMSLMAFNPNSKIFNDCDLKIIFNRHDGFYIPRDEFIRHTNMKDKEQVGYLKKEFKFILCLVTLVKKEYHLIGCLSEDRAKRLLSAISLANRYQEILTESRRMAYQLNPYYLEYVVNLCNQDEVYLTLKPSMVSNEKEEMFSKHFISKGEFVEKLQIENFEMKEAEVDKVAMVIISAPQNQIKNLILRHCLLNDDGMTDFGRALRHNSYLRVLWLDKLSITDKSLKFFGSLWQYMPFLDELRITGCKAIKGEQYLSGFLNSITTSLNLQVLDLSRNSLSDINIPILAEELLNIKNLLIKRVDLSYNCFTSRDNWTLYQYYQQSPMKESTELALAPYPIHQEYFDVLTEGKRFSTIVFERVSLAGDDKRKVLTNEDLAVCRDLSEEVNQCVLFQKNIEDIQAVCRHIKSLDFDFPPQYVERLSELVRELVSASAQAEDFYGFSICYECSKLLDVNKSESRNRFNNLTIKFDQLTEDINRLLNFRYQEVKLNAVLHELLSKVINQDVRGTGAELLLLIKDRRDTLIVEYAQKGIDNNYIENEMMETEPYYVLESNEPLEERSKFLNDKILSQVIGCHAKLADYEKMSEYARNELIREYTTGEHEGFSPSTDNVVKTYQDRVIFFLVSPKELMYINKFKPDSLLWMTKALMYYKWSVSVKPCKYIDIKDKVAKICKQQSPAIVSTADCFKVIVIVDKLVSMDINDNIEQMVVKFSDL